jgi:hemerythrin-like domain-containing protein
MNPTRRQLLAGAALSGASLLLNSCARGRKPSEAPQASDEEAGKKNEEVSAVEDLMREHGVLRRLLLVYGETAPELSVSTPIQTMEALQKTARLFRAFGEDYHERQLEEAAIFPAVKSAGGPAASIVDVLIAQHIRGREITDALLLMTRRRSMGSADAASLSRMLSSFARMYQNHAAREDTLVFPAWKRTLSQDQLDDMAGKFEDIERRQFGKDGFEEAVRKIEEIEEALGFADLGQFTAPHPAAVRTER